VDNEVCGLHTHDFVKRHNKGIQIAGVVVPHAHRQIFGVQRRINGRLNERDLYEVIGNPVGIVCENLEKNQTHQCDFVLSLNHG